MADEIFVRPEPITQSNGKIIISATITGPTGQQELWYSVAQQYSAYISPRADAFALAALFTAMASHGSLRIGGAVSRSLLRNLEEFSHIWSMWKPQVYRPVSISAIDVLDDDSADRQSGYLASFSGGVDACATLLRHVKMELGWRRRTVKSALMIHGFDIPLKHASEFESALQRSRQICDSVDVNIIPMATNADEFSVDWEDSFTPMIASCMNVLAGGFRGAIFGSSQPYKDFLLPVGSNPVSDVFVGSSHFEFFTDGAELQRIDKVALLTTWPEAIRHMRVCWEGREKDRNCGRCEKCIRTQLELLCVGIKDAPCFPPGFNAAVIRTLERPKGMQISYLTSVLERAKAQGMHRSWWARELARVVHRRDVGIKTLVRKTRETVAIRTRLKKIMARTVAPTDAVPAASKQAIQ